VEADIARLDNSAPYRKGGHRETCFIVRVEAQYKLIFAAESILYELRIGCMCVVLLNSVKLYLRGELFLCATD